MRDVRKESSPFRVASRFFVDGPLVVVHAVEVELTVPKHEVVHVRQPVAEDVTPFERLHSPGGLDLPLRLRRPSS